MAFDWFKDKTHIMRVIFVVIILYAIGTVAFFCLTGFSGSNRDMLNSYVTLAYSVVSFALAAFISAYHLLSTMVHRRKRKTDWIEI